MVTSLSEPTDNLWLAEELWQLDAIQLGSYTLGRTAVDSPIYINLRKLISRPVVLSRCAILIKERLEALVSMRHPQVQPFTLVAGVPFGGLHVATAFSLQANVPMVYLHRPEGSVVDRIEGNYVGGQSCLIIDDLITGGGSIIRTVEGLSDFGLNVRDAAALIDRQEGGQLALKRAGVNLVCILSLTQIANYLRSQEYIDSEWHERILAYIDSRSS